MAFTRECSLMARCAPAQTSSSLTHTGHRSHTQGGFSCRDADPTATSASCSTSASATTGVCCPQARFLRGGLPRGDAAAGLPSLRFSSRRTSSPVSAGLSSRSPCTLSSSCSEYAGPSLSLAGAELSLCSRIGAAQTGVRARVDDDDSDRTSASSSASLFSPGSPAKFGRLDSTLPLSATASSFKASVRVMYSLATHGGLIAFGCLICQLAGTNSLNTMSLDPLELSEGVLLALPPIALAAILHWEPVVQSWEVARGVRDAEDEELSEYYLGMTPGQYLPVAITSALSQEVFFRAALQGGLAMAMFLGGAASLEGNLLSDLGAPCSIGMAAVSGYFPAFAPFSQLHAAIVTAAITGSFDYATSMRSVPNVIITDGRNPTALKSTFGEWYQRQQLKSIYAPMFTAMLALYFGLEWILVGNLLAPVISHSIYLAWSMNSGLARLEQSRSAELRR